MAALGHKRPFRDSLAQCPLLGGDSGRSAESFRGTSENIQIVTMPIQFPKISETQFLVLSFFSQAKINLLAICIFLAAGFSLISGVRYVCTKTRTRQGRT